MRLHSFKFLGGISLASALAGCTSYHPVPLPQGSRLGSHLSGITLKVPDTHAPGKIVALNPDKPLKPEQVGLLAAINDPELVYERARIVTAKAKLKAGETLPNPSLGLSYASVISGPGIAGAVTASLSQDIQSIITYKARAKASRYGFKQLSAEVLWREWQVAQKAQLLATSLYFDTRELAIRRKHERLLSSQLAAIRKAAGEGNADLTAEAPIEAARAVAQKDLEAAELTELKHWIALDKLLGLEPSVRFSIGRPATAQVPGNFKSLVLTIQNRRPDIVALQMGYAASQASVRAAILAQFPPFNLGLSGGSDTSKVVTVGPQISMDLPVFHSAKTGIDLKAATRDELRKQYQARLDAAVGDAQGLKARFDHNAHLLTQARRAASLASNRLALAEKAYDLQQIDQRTLVDFESAATQRKLEVVSYQRSLYDTAVGLATSLGANLPVVSLSSVKE